MLSCLGKAASMRTSRMIQRASRARVESSDNSLHCDLFAILNLCRGTHLAVGASSDQLLQIELRRAAAGLPVAALAVARLRPAEALGQAARRRGAHASLCLWWRGRVSVRGTVPWRLRAGRLLGCAALAWDGDCKGPPT